MDDDPSSSLPSAGNTAQTLVVEVHDTDQLLGEPLSLWLANAANSVCSHLSNKGQVRALIVDDQRMCNAHQQYSAIDSTTDVLTFDLAHEQSPEDKVLDTDLIICIDEADRQAANRNHNPEHELLLYIIHGVLHCLGYNDHDDDSFERMHAREDELFKLAGFEPLFHSASQVEEETA
jgi:probable rRNA maturation factor